MSFTLAVINIKYMALFNNNSQGNYQTNSFVSVSLKSIRIKTIQINIFGPSLAMMFAHAKKHSTWICCPLQCSLVPILSNPSADSWSDFVGLHVLCDQWARGSQWVQSGRPLKLSSAISETHDSCTCIIWLHVGYCETKIRLYIFFSLSKWLSGFDVSTSPVCADMLHVHLYTGKSLCVLWVPYCGVLWLADAGALEQMWHLNGLLFGKQVAECDRS